MAKRTPMDDEGKARISRQSAAAALPGRVLEFGALRARVQGIKGRLELVGGDQDLAGTRAWP